MALIKPTVNIDFRCLYNYHWLLARQPCRAYTCVKYTFLHLSDMLLASVTIILKPVRYYGSIFTWPACSLSIRISNNSSTMNMCLPEKQ